MRRYMRLAIGVLGVMLACAGSARAEGGISFPGTEQEIVRSLSFKEQKVQVDGQEYVTNEKGEVFMVVGGKMFRTKGIAGTVQKNISPKAGALIHFDYNSATIKESSHDLLKKWGKALAEGLPDARIVVEGHTDAVGSQEYNMKLSEERAQAIKQYLVTHFNISKDRLVVKGAGMSDPIASNETEEGRSRNRRVEFMRMVQ